ncbi:hypothetical protein BpHYR1_002259 [Brachionus plicatilis]|uniref:Uncharacterized protein n=1 Tax=Brachionus plicatilis TaxID=10195 RepID=A0A3M7SM41_BRAPC|nr:hypothetical protein BpHYR1_002259 [Brachionus plicatilis]
MNISLSRQTFKKVQSLVDYPTDPFLGSNITKMHLGSIHILHICLTKTASAGFLQSLEFGLTNLFNIVLYKEPFLHNYKINYSVFTFCTNLGTQLETLIPSRAVCAKDSAAMRPAGISLPVLQNLIPITPSKSVLVTRPK